MKFFPLFLKKSKLVLNISAVAGAALFFSACKTDDTPAPGISALAVTYAVPDGVPVNFYLDNQLRNSSPFTFGTKIDYVQVYEGPHNLKTVLPADNSILLEKVESLTPGEYFSLYIVNKKANMEYLLVNDKIVAPPSGNATVRFMNLAPDATALDLQIVDETAKFENKAFKAYTDFVNVPEKAKATIKLINRANANAVVAELADVELKAGNIYTIWAKGLLTTTETAQQIAIKVSKH